MKNNYIITFVFVLVFCPISLFAQTQKGNHELHVQVGDGLPPTIVEGITIGLSQAFGTAFSGYKIKGGESNSASAIYGIGYKYHITPRFSVGADIDYMQLKRDYTLTKKNEADRYGKRSTSLVSALAIGQFIYLNREKVLLYGELGVGITYYSGHTAVNNDRHDYEGTTIGLQFNPIGVRFGKRYGGFLTIGAGTKSIFTVGFSVRL